MRKISVSAGLLFAAMISFAEAQSSRIPWTWGDDRPVVRQGLAPAMTYVAPGGSVSSSYVTPGYHRQYGNSVYGIPGSCYDDYAVRGSHYDSLRPAVVPYFGGYGFGVGNFGYGYPPYGGLGYPDYGYGNGYYWNAGVGLGPGYPGLIPPVIISPYSITPFFGAGPTYLPINYSQTGVIGSTIHDFAPNPVPKVATTYVSPEEGGPGSDNPAFMKAWRDAQKNGGSVWPPVTPRTDQFVPPARISSTEARLKSLESQAVGDIALQHQKWQEACHAYQKAVNQAEDRAEAHFRLGVANAALQKFDLAAKSLTRAVLIDPTITQNLPTLTELLGAEQNNVRLTLLGRTGDWVKENVRDPNRLFVLAVLLYADRDPRAGEVFVAASRMESGPSKRIMAFQTPASATSVASIPLAPPTVSEFAPSGGKAALPVAPQPDVPAAGGLPPAPAPEEFPSGTLFPALPTP